MANDRALYPRAFQTPEGRMVSIGVMARALSAIRRDRFAYVDGWDWFEVPGHFVLSRFREGLHDRINRRAGAAPRQPRGRVDYGRGRPAGRRWPRWRVRYRDPDPGCPIFVTTVRAPDRASAEIAFWESGEDTDWLIVSIGRI